MKLLMIGTAVLLAAGLAEISYELVQTKNEKARLLSDRELLVNIVHMHARSFEIAANTLDTTCHANLARRVMIDRDLLGIAAITAQYKAKPEAEQCQSLVQDFRELSAKSEKLR
jgi:hypothetical protein